MDRTMSVRALAVAVLLVAGAGAAANAQAPTVTVFEGARLINGDGNVTEDSALVVQGNRIVAVGRRADVQDFTCFQAGNEGQQIARGVRAELGDLYNTPRQA